MFKLPPIAFTVALISCNASANELEGFNLSFVHNIEQGAAEQLLNKSHTIYDIDHRVGVIVNDSFLGVRKIHAFNINNQTCVSEEAFNGVPFSKKFWEKYRNKEKGCVFLDKEIMASSYYDFSSQEVRFSFPQSAFQTGEENDINWDFGDTGLNIYYIANAASTAEDDISAFGSVDARVNFKKWRLLAKGYSNNEETKFNEFLLKRDLPSIKSKLHLGNTYLPSDVNSFSFDGAILSSEDGYRSWAEDRYIPTISGVASSTSRIEITQDNRIILSEIIQAGPYEYSEYPIFGSGELVVTVTDQAGNSDVTIYPVTISPYIKPIGSVTYNVALGNNDELENGLFAYSDYAGGFDGYTLGLNGLAAQKYQNVGANIALGLNYWGAISFGANAAFTNTEENLKGLRYKFDYSNGITSNLTFGIVNMGYQDKEYRLFSEHESEITDDEALKSDTVVSLNSSIFESSSIYTSGFYREYWSGGKEKGVNLGFSNKIGRTSLSLNGSYSERDTDISDDSSWGVSLSLSIPLGDSVDSPNLRTMYTNNNSEATYTANVTGNPTKRTSYNISASHRDDGDTIANLGLTHDFDVVNTSASIGDSKNGDFNWSASVSGSIVKISDSPVAFSSKRLASTAIIKVGEEDGVRLRGGKYESRNGMILVSLAEMTSNEKIIDLSSLSVGTEAEQLVYNFDATSEAMYYRSTEVFKSIAATFDIHKDTVIPIGSEVTQNGNHVGTVGMDNLTYVGLKNTTDNLQISDSDGEKVCEITISDIDFSEVSRDEVPLYQVGCSR